MTTKEMKMSLAMLKVAYPQKQLTEEEAILMFQLWYDEFKNYDFNDFQIVVRKIISKNKFFPSISEINESLMENQNDKIYQMILEMKAEGYFKFDSEFFKTIEWYKSKTLPGWFIEDLKKFNNRQITQNGGELECKSL